MNVTDVVFIRLLRYFRTITEDQLEELFGKFGRIVQKNILKDKITGLPRGVAFVRLVGRFIIVLRYLSDSKWYNFDYCLHSIA